MATYKYIYLRKDMPANKPGRTFVNVHLLEGYNPARIRDMQRMAKLMKKDIREVKVDAVECGHVTKSSYCDRFTLARWDGEILATPIALHDLEQAGWRIIKDGHPDYHWI